MPLDASQLALFFPDLTGFSFVTQGGQKGVYRATHQAHGLVALKIFAAGADAARFEREIAAVAGIASAHVPRIYTSGALSSGHGGNLWLIERWIEGTNLRDCLNAASIPNATILQISLEMLSVLALAEQAKIVHRDIKPENILTTLHPSTSWLTDFGIARLLDRSTLTHGPWGVFTCGYAPIEQFRNAHAEIDSRADLFALGVTLFECVEGNNPFRFGAAANDEIIRRVENTSLPRLSRQIDVAGEFSDLISAMTKTKRIHRIGTARDAYQWMQEIYRLGAR